MIVIMKLSSDFACVKTARCFLSIISGGITLDVQKLPDTRIRHFPLTNSFTHLIVTLGTIS